MKPSYLSYVIDLLQSSDWMDVSENVDIAKGKYKVPSTWKEFISSRKWQ
jgi:hypothetical protein